MPQCRATLTNSLSGRKVTRMSERFTGSFTQQEPIPEAGIEAAMQVLRHGRLHRYNLAAGEAGEATLLEEEFAAYLGAKYCVAVTSGGYAHHVEKSVALGFVPPDMIAEGAQFEIEILGEMRPATLVTEALFDPKGERMRG